MSSADHTSSWQTLVALALIGTERRPYTPLLLSGVLGEQVARLEATTPERALLGAAALLSHYRRAGAGATIDESDVPPPCPPETLQPCGPRAAHHLRQMLGGQHRELLDEWLALAAKHRRRAPLSLLPALLELGRTHPADAPAIIAVLGERGTWLASMQDSWRYARVEQLAGVPSRDDALVRWQTGDRATRLALIQALRASQPGVAREVMQSTWSSEKAEDRAAWLAILEHTLSLDDEPLLEQALDDRARDVRRAAAGLLARLPGSKLQTRLFERAAALLTWRKRLLRSAVIEVALLEACDPAMARDGVEPKPQGTLGERAWWLHQLLVLTPPEAWTQHWAAQPAEIITAAQGEWKDVLLGAWLASAAYHNNADWAEALLTSNALPVTAELESLVRVLPPERRERYLTRLIRDNAPTVSPLLRQCTHPWSETFARTVITFMRAQITSGSRQPNWLILTTLKESARLVPPTLAAEFARGWPTEAPAWPAWQNAVERFLVVVQFRADMHEALERGV